MGSDPALRQTGTSPILAGPVTGILLAAGSSTRFGGHKLSHLIDGVPMALRSANAMKAALGAVLVAMRPGDALAPTISATGIEVIFCDRASEGMGGTLAQAVAAAPAGGAGYVIALADMPFIAPTSIRAVADAIVRGAAVAVPTYRGERGHPVGLSSAYRDALLALAGDAGARALVRRDARHLMLVAVDDPGVLRDIDTPADLPPSDK
jgi:molybdenum cofactor cytidylyltransferase